MRKVKGFKDTIAWYDANAKQYAQNVENFSHARFLNTFAKLVGKGSKVLDVGCSAGRDCRQLKHRGLQPIGIDISENLLKVAKEKHPDIEFHQGDFLNLPYKRETFNGVWASASLLHLEKIADVQQALGEFLRVLKPKGVLYIQVKKQTASEKTSVVFDTLSSHERFFRWFDSQELLNLLEKAGFKFLSMEIIDDLAGRQEVQWICIFSRKP